MDIRRAESPPRGIEGPVRDALRYWEPRRVPYNLVLAGIVAAWLIVTWPHFRHAATLQSLVALLVLAALANACYSTAYVADIAMQRSSLRRAWLHSRWVLWFLGTGSSAVLAFYWIADEIYPYVG